MGKRTPSLKRAQTMTAMRKAIRKATLLLATKCTTTRESTSMTKFLQALTVEHIRLQKETFSDDVQLVDILESISLRRNLAMKAEVATVHQLAMCPPTLLRKSLQTTRCSLMKEVLLFMQTPVSLAAINKRRIPKTKKIDSQPT